MQDITVNTFYPTRPHAKQLEVLKALDEGQRFILLRAGRKFRKTSLMISWLVEKALQTGLVAPYVAPNRIQAKNIVWGDHMPRLLDHFREQKVPFKVNESELSVRFANGGKVQLLGVDNKDTLRGISNWGAIACDEYDDWIEDIYPLIIRPNLITYKAPIIIGGTPKGYRNIYRLEQGKIFKAFHFTSMDNPDLDAKELQELVEEYKEMGEGYYRQEILAEYEKPQGTVYQEWDMPTRYLPFEYDPNLPVHLSWDFGVNDPTAIVFIQPHGSEIRVFDYYEASNSNIEHFAQWIASRPYKFPSFEAGDIAGRARELTSGKSVIDELAKLGHFIRTTPIPNINQQIRNAHKFIPRLFVSSTNPNCERFMQCIVNYRYPSVKSTATDQENENPIHDEFSHAMRAFEYYCWNMFDPQQKINLEPPRFSIEAHLRRKQEERFNNDRTY